MTRIVADGALLSKLGNLTEPVELYDESGRLRGRVFPVRDMSAYQLVEPPTSDEELARREQSGKRRYTTAEVLHHLEKL